MRISSPAIQVEPERLQVASTERTTKTEHNPTAGEPGLRIELSPEAAQALKTGADPTQASSPSDQLQTYQRSGATTQSTQSSAQVEAGANRAPPIQDWSIDFVAIATTPGTSEATQAKQQAQVDLPGKLQESEAPQAQDLAMWEPTEASTQSDDAATGRNVGAIYLQNAATGPQEPLTAALDTAAGVEARPGTSETQTADAVQEPAEV